MGLIQKLNEIKTIKDDIRDAIVEKGGVLEDTTPFENYAGEIRNIQTGEEFEIQYPAYLFYNGTRWDIKDVLLPRMKNAYPNYYHTFEYFTGENEIELNVGNAETNHYSGAVFPKYASLQYTFANSSFTKIKLNILDIDTEIMASNCFYYARSLTDIYCNFDYVNFNYLNNICYSCDKLQNIHFKFNLDKTACINSGFTSCPKLKRIDFMGRMTSKMVVYTTRGKKLNDNYFAFNNSNTYPQISRLASNCSLLETVTGLDITNVKSITNMFSQCPKLTTLEFTGTENVVCDINSLSETGLTRDGLIHMLSTLPTLDHTQTIVIGSTKMSLLTDEDIAEFTAKGYTLA